MAESALLAVSRLLGKPVSVGERCDDMVVVDERHVESVVMSKQKQRMVMGRWFCGYAVGSGVGRSGDRELKRKKKKKKKGREWFCFGDVGEMVAINNRTRLWAR